MPPPETDQATGPLTYQVFNARRPGLSRDLPPGYESLMWVSNAATLIAGERDAVLVDTFLTIDHGDELADLIAASGKNLTHVYITHGHGGHFFGINALKERFPTMRAVATASIGEVMKTQFEPEMMDGFWRRLFPEQIADDPGMAESLDGATIQLEGHPLIPIETGHTDIADSTSLHAPSIALIAAGDVVYNGIHPYLAESSAQTRLEWIDALAKLEALEPRAVVAGHKVPDHDDDPRNIAETRQYLRDFIRLDEETDSPRALFDAMIELYPDRANPGSLWGAASAAKRETGNGAPPSAATPAARHE
jgi:glyoxylase-like metal-dependent hydrolase (beta-lactamase superfamily II)